MPACPEGVLGDVRGALYPPHAGPAEEAVGGAYIDCICESSTLRGRKLRGNEVRSNTSREGKEREFWFNLLMEYSRKMSKGGEPKWNTSQFNWVISWNRIGTRQQWDGNHFHG